MTTEPKPLTEADIRAGLPRLSENDLSNVLALFRERGLIAEEPVDRLMKKAVELVGLWLPDETELRHEAIDLALAALRRGMELAPRKTLTREMVEEMTFPACDAAYREVYCDPVPEVRTPYVKAFARHFYAAIQEALL